MKTKANIGLDFGTALWYTLNMEEKNYFEEERIKPVHRRCAQHVFLSDTTAQRTTNNEEHEIHMATKRWLHHA